MFKSFHSLFLAVLLNLLLCSIVVAESIQKPFLWKIEAETTSYMFGTIHLPDPRVTTLHPSVEQAFITSEYVYTEIPLDSSNLLSQASYLMLPDDKTLTDVVESGLLQKVDSIIKKINPILGIEPFLKFKVWALATSLPLLEQQLAHPGVLPLDAQLFQRAEKEGKGTGGLETIQEQISYFDSLSQYEELKMLRDTVEFMEQADSQQLSLAEEFIQYYLYGDVDAFGKLMIKYVKQDKFSKDFMQKILHDRNIIMADRIHAKVKKYPERSYFFAVGAGHYWGETSIQKLLQDKGLKISRIK